MSRKIILCRCEDVTLADVQRALALGYGDIEEIKRYTGFGTGPCQGKYCLQAFACLAGSTDDGPIALPTTRPPLRPVRLGDLVFQSLFNNRILSGVGRVSAVNNLTRTQPLGTRPAASDPFAAGLRLEARASREHAEKITSPAGSCLASRCLTENVSRGRISLTTGSRVHCPLDP